MDGKNKFQNEPGDAQLGGELSEADIRFRVEAVAKEQELSQEQVEKFVKLLSAWQSTDLPSAMVYIREGGEERRTSQQELMKGLDNDLTDAIDLGDESDIANMVAGYEKSIQEAIGQGDVKSVDMLKRSIEHAKESSPKYKVEMLRSGKGNTNNFYFMFMSDLEIDQQGVVTTDNMFYKPESFLLNKKFNGAWRDICNERLPDIIHVLKVVNEYCAHKGENPYKDGQAMKTLGQIAVELYDKYGIPPYLLGK